MSKPNGLMTLNISRGERERGLLTLLRPKLIMTVEQNLSDNGNFLGRFVEARCIIITISLLTHIITQTCLMLQGTDWVRTA